MKPLAGTRRNILMTPLKYLNGDVFSPTQMLRPHVALWMATHELVTNPGIYYITFTCYHWLNLIERTNSYQAVYKWFNILNSNAHAILGYVIMPNHAHLILYFAEYAQSLNTVVGNGKRFIGYEIVSRLKNHNETALLQQLRQVFSLTTKAVERNMNYGRIVLTLRNVVLKNSSCKN
jgi:hypothetical protein